MTWGGVLKGKTKHKQHDGLNSNGKNKEKKKTTEASLVIARAKKKKKYITAVEHWSEKTDVMPWLVVLLEACHLLFWAGRAAPVFSVYK